MNIDSLDSSSVNLSGVIKMIERDFIKTELNEDGLNGHVQGLYDFYNKRNEEYGKGRKLTLRPYQYLPENQHEWLKHIVPLSRELHACYKIITETYKELFSLETVQPMREPPISTQQPSVQVDARQMTPEKQPRFSLFGGIRKAIQPEKVTPFKLEIEPIKYRRQRVQDFYDYINYHNFKCDWDEYFIDMEGLYDLLDIEKVQFGNRIAPVITIITEGYEFKRESNKRKGIELGGASLALSERHRMPTM